MRNWTYQWSFCWTFKVWLIQRAPNLSAFINAHARGLLYSHVHVHGLSLCLGFFFLLNCFFFWQDEILSFSIDTNAWNKEHTFGDQEFNKAQCFMKSQVHGWGSKGWMWATKAHYGWSQQGKVQSASQPVWSSCLLPIYVRVPNWTYQRKLRWAANCF